MPACPLLSLPASAIHRARAHAPLGSMPPLPAERSCSRFPGARGGAAGFLRLLPVALGCFLANRPAAFQGVRRQGLLFCRLQWQQMSISPGLHVSKKSAQNRTPDSSQA